MEDVAGRISVYYIENINKRCFLSDTCESWIPDKQKCDIRICVKGGTHPKN